MLRRTRHLLARLFGAVFVGLMVAAAFGAWRLSQGPVSLSLLVPTLQEALARPDLGLTTEIDTARLIWSDFGHDPEIAALGVRVRRPDGNVVLAVPELRLTLSARALLRGEVSPARLEVSGLDLTLARRADGSIDFGVTAVPAAGTPPSDQAPGAAGQGLPLSELLEPPDPRRPGGYLRDVRIADATVELRDEVRGLSWRAAPAEVVLHRDAEGARASASVDVEYAGRRGTVTLEALRRPRGERTEASLRLDAVPPEFVAPFLPKPELAAIVDAPLTGTMSVVLERDERLVSARTDMRAGAGSLHLSGRTVAIDGAGLRAGYDAANGELLIDRFAATVGGEEMTAEGVARRAGAGYATDVRFGGIRPDVLAGPLGLDALAGVAVPLSGTARATIDADARPLDGRVEVTMGAGRVDRPALFPEPLDLRGGSLVAVLGQQGKAITVERLALDVGAAITAKGSATFDLDRVSLNVETDIRDLAVNDLRKLWPLGVAPGGRRWVTAQLRDGSVPHVQIRLGFVLGGTDFGEVLSQSVAGSVDFGGVQARYWDPMPAMREVKGSLTFTDKRLDLKIESARDGQLAIEGGTTVLTGFDTGPGTAEVDVALRSPFAELMTRLDRPPLGYAKKLGVEPGELAGQVQGRLHVKLPLIATVTMDQIDVTAKGVVEGGRLPRAALNRDLTEARVELDVDKHRLVAKGTGLLAASPARFEVTQAFERQAREQIRADASIDLTDADRRSFGFDTDPLTVDGPAKARIVYVEQRGGRADLTGDIDLAGAVVALKPIGWTKPAGRPAKAALALVLQNGKAVSIDRATLTADKFDGEARIGFDAAGKVRQVDVIRLKQGADNDFSMRAVLAGKVVTIDARGAAFDLEPLLSDAGKPSGEAGKPPGEAPGRAQPVEKDETEIRVSGRIERLRLAAGPPLQGARGDVRLVGGDLVAAQVAAATANAEQVGLSITEAGGKRRVSIDAADGGALLASLDLTDKLRGGKLTLRAERNPADPASPYAGRLEIDGFRLVKAPFLARLLGAAALTGIGDLLSADSGLAFDKLEAPFRFHQGRFDLPPGRAFGTSVGITWRGNVDLGKDNIDIAGTLVPAYAINRVLGAIPIIGFLITGGEGSGALAATYRVSGTLDKPQMSVNPLTVLLPGFLRGLFDALIGGGDTGEPQPHWDPSQDPAAGQAPSP